MHLLVQKKGTIEIVLARHSTRLACVIEAMERKLVFGASYAGYWLRPGVEIIKEP